MRNRFSKVILILFIILVCLIVIIGCLYVVISIDQSTAPERLDSTSIGEFYFDPKTIITNLNAGETNVFFLSPVAFEVQNNILYSYDEYLQITDEIFSQVWEDKATNWLIRSHSLKTNCEFSGKGFYQGFFNYFRGEVVNSEQKRIERFVIINPGEGTIRWGIIIRSGNLDYWNENNFTQINVSADEALNIAEINGGKSIRLEIDNDCYLDMSLIQHALYEGWWINYQQYTGKNYFYPYYDEFFILINPQNGEFDIVENDFKKNN